MKNIKLFTLLAAVALTPIFITSCGDTETTTPEPTLEFIGGGSYVASDIDLPVNTDFTVGLNASHTAKIETLKITVSINGGAELTPSNCTLCDTTFGSNSFRVDFNGTTGTSVGTEKWSFTIADKDGVSTTKTITINVLASGDVLYEYEMDNSTPPKQHRVYNFIGPNLGAYEIGGGPLQSGDLNSLKDIQDSVTAAEGANWPGRWGSRNGATYKKVTTYNWSTMTNTAQLQSAWDESGTATAVILPKKGDFYAMKLSSGLYAFVEITDVVTTPSDNLDYVQFRYKYRD